MKVFNRVLQVSILISFIIVSINQTWVYYGAFCFKTRITTGSLQIVSGGF